MDSLREIDTNMGAKQRTRHPPPYKDCLPRIDTNIRNKEAPRAAKPLENPSEALPRIGTRHPSPYKDCLPRIDTNIRNKEAPRAAKPLENLSEALPRIDTNIRNREAARSNPFTSPTEALTRIKERLLNKNSEILPSKKTPKDFFKDDKRTRPN